MNHAEAFQERDDSYPLPRLRCDRCGRFVANASVRPETLRFPRYHTTYDDAGRETGVVIDGEDTDEVFVAHCRACGHLTLVS
jgi:hypothetical protein